MKINEIILEQINTWQEMEQEIIQDITNKTGDRPAELMKINTQKAAQDAFALYATGKPQKDSIAQALANQGIAPAPKHDPKPAPIKQPEPQQIKKPKPVKDEPVKKIAKKVKKKTQTKHDALGKKFKDFVKPVTEPFDAGRQTATKLLKF